MVGYNFTDVKNNNRYEIIQKIYQNTDVNRNFITQVTGLTNAAVTKIINSLIKERFISEKNYFSNFRGRKARYLSISEGSYGIITLYSGRSMIIASIADICGKIIHSQTYLVDYHTLNDIIFGEVISETIGYFPVNLSCLGCVVITPGIRSVEETDDPKKISEMPYFWNLSTLSNIMKSKYHIPLYSDNVANAALLGEKWFGKGRDINNFVLYSIGKGIGSSVCIQGKLLRGYHNSAIEIGHVTINFEGPNCDCGNRGCLELYASTDSWEQKLSQLDAYSVQKNKMEAMFIKALHKDSTSMNLLNEYIQMVTIGAVILTSMFSPEKLIISTNEADYIYLAPFIQTIKKELETRIYSTQRDEILVEASELRQTGITLGCIAIAMERTLLAP